jgi:type I restriction enzyme S subunit
MQSFWKQQIPLPPLAEQKRIAAILDKADAIRRKLQQSLRLCDEFLRSVFLDMFGDPVTNPKGWPFVQIGDLLESTSYGTSKKASETTGAFPCLRMNNITYSGGWDFTSLKYVDLDSKEQKNNLVHSGQLLFNRTNSKELVGKTAVYRRKDPMAFAGYLVRGIANSQADTEYISAYLNLPHGKAVLQSMCKNIIGMANINAEEFKSIRIQNPPVAMQKRFAAIVHSTELKKETLHKFLSESESLFSSLQQRAFRGEL